MLGKIYMVVCELQMSARYGGYNNEKTTSQMKDKDSVVEMSFNFKHSHANRLDLLVTNGYPAAVLPGHYGQATVRDDLDPSPVPERYFSTAAAGHLS